MSRSISEINARCLKFVKTCINVIIITLFYTNCTCGLAKTNLGYLKQSKKFFDWGLPPRPPSKYAHVHNSTSSTLLNRIVTPHTKFDLKMHSTGLSTHSLLLRQQHWCMTSEKTCSSQINTRKSHSIMTQHYRHFIITVELPTKVHYRQFVKSSQLAEPTELRA